MSVCERVGLVHIAVVNLTCVVLFLIPWNRRPAGDLVFDISTEEGLAHLAAAPFVMKQGCKYKFQISFRVQVGGLKGVVIFVWL